MIASPWNPHVIVLPLLAFVVVAAAFVAAPAPEPACPRARWRRSIRYCTLPGMVFLGSFLAQTHIAAAPPVVALLIIAAVARRDAIRAAWPAAVAVDAVLTPYHALKSEGALKPGEKVAIVGLGGLGLNAVQVALALGGLILWAADLVVYVRRRRRLLLHKKQIRELWNNVRMKGMTIVPTRVYLKDGRAKIEIALAKGKKAYDKRATIAKRDEARSAERESRVR